MANIRTARRSGLVFRGGRNRRESLWIGFVTSETSIATASTAVLAFVLNAAALAQRPFTVVRTRLFWYVRSDVVTGGEEYGGALGMCVVSDQAEAIGVTAVPTPVTDIGSDLFFVFEQQYGRFGGTQVEEVGQRKEIDSKAMRKVVEDESVILTLESGPGAVSASMVSVIGGRMLIKLH